MNYLQDYFKNQNRVESYSTYFNGYADDVGLSKIDKELKSIQKQLADKEHEYVVKLNKGFTKNYTPAKYVPILKYDNSRNTGALYFDGINGMGITECPELCTVYTLPVKSGNISIVTGYCYELGAIIIREYNYNIANNNASVRLSLVKEMLVPLLETDKNTVYVYTKGVMTTSECGNYAIPRTPTAEEFISNMFGINRAIDFDLIEFRDYYRDNKATEVILKTAPDDALKLLLKTKYDKSTKLNLLLNLSEEDYNLCIKNNVLAEFVRVRKQMNEANIVNFKTSSELVKFIITCREYEETLKFYKIHYGTYDFMSLAWQLIQAFTGCTYNYREYKNAFINNYKFGKFCYYVVNGSVDQGFTSIDNFINKLGDYLLMCGRYGSKPITETSDLIKLHNIMSRNHNLAFSSEQVTDFKVKYTDFTQFMKDNYVVVAPEGPHDLCVEGDSLGHCVAFYVKRVIDNECLVLFLRLKDKLKESLLTLEVKNNTITQAEGLLGRGPSSEEAEIIKAFAKDRNYEVALDIE